MERPSPPAVQVIALQAFNVAPSFVAAHVEVTGTLIDPRDAYLGQRNEPNSKAALTKTDIDVPQRARIGRCYAMNVQTTGVQEDP